eukprot:8635833-Pyramimonas_sp.AAC.1
MYCAFAAQRARSELLIPLRDSCRLRASVEASGMPALRFTLGVVGAALDRLGDLGPCQGPEDF